MAELHLHSIRIRPLHECWEADTSHVHGACGCSQRELRPRALCSATTESAKLQLCARHISQHNLKLLPSSGALPPCCDCWASTHLSRSHAQPCSLDTVRKPPPKGGGVCQDFFETTKQLQRKECCQFCRYDARACSLEEEEEEIEVLWHEESVGRIGMGRSAVSSLRADRCCITSYNTIYLDFDIIHYIYTI